MYTFVCLYIVIYMIASLFAYDGNKDREVNVILDNLPPMENIDIIIEPYGGTFSLIRHLIKKYPDKKYIVNDSDVQLISLYKHLQDSSNIDEFINKVKEFDGSDKAEYNRIKKMNTLESFYFIHKVYGLRSGVPPVGRTTKVTDKAFETLREWSKGVQNVIFTNEDGMTCIDRHKDNDRAFVFLDPPYLSDMVYRAKPDQSFLSTLLDMTKYKAYMLAVYGSGMLIESFYKANDIHIKFTTSIRFNRKADISTIPYVSNYV